LWFAVAIGLLSAVGQFFWWKKMDKKILWNELFFPFISALLISVIIINSAKVYNVGYSLLLFAGLFTIFSNGKIFYTIIKANPGLSGGAIAPHRGGDDASRRDVFFRIFHGSFPE
jgi:cytochrome c-type biogenesis protein CcmF